MALRCVLMHHAMQDQDMHLEPSVASVCLMQRCLKNWQCKKDCGDKKARETRYVAGKHLVQVEVETKVEGHEQCKSSSTEKHNRCRPLRVFSESDDQKKHSERDLQSEREIRNAHEMHASVHEVSLPHRPSVQWIRELQFAELLSTLPQQFWRLGLKRTVSQKPHAEKVCPLNEHRDLSLCAGDTDMTDTIHQ